MTHMTNNENDETLIDNNIIEVVSDSSDEDENTQCECETSELPLLDESKQKIKPFFCKHKKKRALLIGINYDEDKFKDDDLNGCVNDLNNLKKFLKEKGGF